MKILFSFSLIFLLQFVFAQESIKFQPKIEYIIQENIIELNSTVLNGGEMISDLNYLFLIIKKGNQGNLSNKKQEGKFVAKQNERIILSKTQMNFDLNDELKAYLFIRDEQENKLLAKDSLILKFDNLTINQSFEDKVLNHIEFKDDEFIIRGLVSDQTKTKIGRDFFDLFYSNYNLMNTKFPFLIEIEELPAQGRNSKVNVKAEDKLIYEFMLNPNEDYMKSVNAQLFQSLYAYDKNRNIINTY